MNVLRGKLAELQERETAAKLAVVRGDQRAIEWGSQIRSYVFQPYTLVKDVRTRVETGEVQKVMDGQLDPFMTGFLRWRSNHKGGGAGMDDSGSDDDDL